LAPSQKGIGSEIGWSALTDWVLTSLTTGFSVSGFVGELYKCGEREWQHDHYQHQTEMLQRGCESGRDDEVLGFQPIFIMRLVSRSMLRTRLGYGVEGVRVMVRRQNKREIVMKRIVARAIILAIFATLNLLTGCTSIPVGVNQQGEARLVRPGSVWRMAIRVGELNYPGPDVRDRYEHNWNDDAKNNYRWAFPIMAVGSGLSALLIPIPAAVIGQGVPILEKDDIVDVYLAYDGMDYGKGRAPIILQRICSGKDDACIKHLRATQGGKIAGVEIEGVYPFPSARKLSPPLKNHHCAVEFIAHLGCSGELPDVSTTYDGSVK
jgi:hypothetical protein